MKKKKTGTMELRFYDIPQNEYVLALLGENWVRDYGHDDTGLHFHNLMEIGYCRSGAGELVLDEQAMPYQPAMLSVIPANYPHTTISDNREGPSFWEYLFLDPIQLVSELYPENELYRRRILEKLSYRALFLHEWENRNMTMLVRMIMEEMRGKRLNYNDSVRGLILALLTEILRVNEREEQRSQPEKIVRRTAGVEKISAALKYVEAEYMHMIRVEELAKQCHMSETHFRRVFESCMNMSPVDYVNLVRIQKACELMKKTNDSMDMVAQKVGYSTTSTFNRNFKKFLGTSPYQWKIGPENYENKLLNYRISALKGW